MCIVRRCGWLDLVVVKYSHKINGYDALCLAKLDILDELSELRIGARYTLDGKPFEGFPADQHALAHVQVEYITVPGARTSLGNWGSWWLWKLSCRSPLFFGYCDCDLFARYCTQAGSAARLGARRGRSCRRRRGCTWTRSSASSVCPCVGFASAMTAALSSSVSRTFRAVSLCQLLPMLPPSSRAFRRIISNQIAYLMRTRFTSSFYPRFTAHTRSYCS